MIAQRSFFAPYLEPALAPALLVAGFCAAKALPELARLPQWARLALLASLSVAAAFSAPGVDLVKRQDLPALTAAAQAIRASGPAPEDKLYVVNRSVWLNSMVDLAPPTKYLFPFQTLCAFPGAGPSAVAEILAARPRYIVIADRRTKYYCERPESWRLIDAALAASYRLLARAPAISTLMTSTRRSPSRVDALPAARRPDAALSASPERRRGRGRPACRRRKPRKQTAENGDEDAENLSKPVEQDDVEGAPAAPAVEPIETAGQRARLRRGRGGEGHRNFRRWRGLPPRKAAMPRPAERR